MLTSYTVKSKATSIHQARQYTYTVPWTQYTPMSAYSEAPALHRGVSACSSGESPRLMGYSTLSRNYSRKTSPNSAGPSSLSLSSGLRLRLTTSRPSSTCFARTRSSRIRRRSCRWRSFERSCRRASLKLSSCLMGRYVRLRMRARTIRRTRTRRPNS